MQYDGTIRLLAVLGGEELLQLICELPHHLLQRGFVTGTGREVSSFIIRGHLLHRDRGKWTLFRYDVIGVKSALNNTCFINESMKTCMFSCHFSILVPTFPPLHRSGKGSIILPHKFSSTLNNGPSVTSLLPQNRPPLLQSPCLPKLAAASPPSLGHEPSP